MLRKKILMLMIILVCAGIAASALAGNRILAAPSTPDAPDEGLAIPWWTVDTGGGRQPGRPICFEWDSWPGDAAILTGGTYTLKGGYWGGSIEYMINLPMVVR